MLLHEWLHAPFLDPRFPLPLDEPFTAAMAYDAGIPRRWLTELVAAGQLRHPVKNCYLSAHLPDDTRTRAQCLRLVIPEDAVVVDRHAGWLQGANMLLLPNEHLNAEPVAVYLPAGRGRLRNKLTASGERTFGTADLTVVDGLRVTTPLRTALDLGRQRWPEPALTALDALHRTGTFTVEELLDGIDRMRGMRWVRTLREVAHHTDGRSQSGGETVIRWRWLHLPVAPPEPQVEVRADGCLAFIDVGNGDVRAGVEYNGTEWHTAPADVVADQERAAWLDRDADWSLDWLVSDQVYGRGACVEDAIMAVHRAAVERTRRRTV